jgi:DNA end-binding protein Ku
VPRALWKGAIAFGLVHIPVALYSGSSRDTIDFDWLDKRDAKPVGYKRVNKETAKEVSKDDIVRGVQYEKNRYVVLSDEEIRGANVKSTQSVDILAFVEAGSIALPYFDPSSTLSADFLRDPRAVIGFAGSFVKNVVSRFVDNS